MRVLAVLSVLVLLLPASLRAAPDAVLWGIWLPHDEGNPAQVDHAAWDRILTGHVAPGADGIARFAYARAGAAVRAELARYLDHLSAQPVHGLSRGEQRAFWINLYNALTVSTVLAHYPVASIRDIRISPGLFAPGPWGRKLVAVAGTPLSLDDIEHRILRPIWRDPRLHYVLNCAALGCPDLPARALTAANADTMLEAAATRFINHPRGARVAEGRLQVSSIYVWFRADFGASDAAVIDHLGRYAEPPLRDALAGRTRLDGHAYDWTLNDATAP